MYRTVEQLNAVIDQLAAEAPSLCTVLPVPERSVLGGRIVGLRITPGRGASARGVVGRRHPRERADESGSAGRARRGSGGQPRSRAPTSCSASAPGRRRDVAAMLDDGRPLPGAVHQPGRPRLTCMTVDDMWRKNRRDNPGTSCDGVDLNRNVDISGASPRARRPARRAPTSTAGRRLSANRRTATSSTCWTPTGSTASPTCTPTPSWSSTRGGTP